MENKEQDRFLPIANISRIMKKALPENAKIAKDAKETMQQCVSDFISFITSEACEKCINDKRKTINGIDLINAMNTLGFSNYIDILKIYLQKYREANKYNTQNIEENEAQSISKHEAELKEVDKHREVYCLANLKANQEESNQYQQNLQQYQEHIQKMIMIQLNNQMQQQQLQIQQQQMQQQQQNNIPASQINQNKSILDEE